MKETIEKEWQAQVSILVFLLLSLWWLINPIVIPLSYKIRFFGDFPSLYGIMALWGGICGIYISNKWGGIKSTMGKVLFVFSLGLFAQEFGQIIYAYFSFYKHIEVPYPSLGDLGYFGSIPLYIAGVIFLAKAAGADLSLKNFAHRLQAILIPLVLLVISYLIFLKGYEFDWSNPLKIFLDFGYPFGQAIYISLALLTYLLSRNILGGIMKNKILFILFALLVQYVSDFTFLYQSSKGTWQAGGINDYMYLVSYFLMTLGLLQFNTVLTKLRQAQKN
ncbi:MAG: hypothetical protein ACD_20C00153G0002 [uncultured bacterium]|nr:MAG: hypothetical protein ACD_20C00153G0002 [uncultured bacterium]